MPKASVSHLMLAQHSPPGSSPRNVRRGRLLEVALGASRANVTLVRAPAGFGKTTFMSQWHQVLRDQGARSLWVTLDEASREPTQFAGVLLDSIHRCSENAGCLLTGDPASTVSTAPAEAVVAACARVNGPVTIFLDDFEAADAAFANRCFGLIAAYGASPVHFVLGARKHPVFASERLRLLGQVRELGPAALRFDAVETADLIAGLPDGCVSHTELEAAEGWPIALDLTARQGAIRSAGPRVAAGTHDDAGVLSDYFMEEIVVTLPAALREFLLDISILDVLRADLVDHVRQSSLSAQSLHELHAGHGLLTSIDPQQQSFRLPTLYRHALLRALTAEDPQRALQLHTRASSWHERKGEILPAIRHALAVEDRDRVAAIIERAGGIRLAFRLGPGAARTILEHLPKPLLLSNPRIAVLKAFQLLKDGAIDEARSLARIASASDAWSTPVTDDFVFDQAILELLFAVDTGPIHESLAKKLGSTRARLDPILAAEIESYGAAAGSYTYQQFGQLRQAAMAVGRWQHLNRLLEWQYNQLYAVLQEGTVAIAHGRLQQARDIYRRVLAAGEKSYAGDHGLRQATNVLLAETFYLAGDLAEAQRLLPSDIRDIEACNCWYDIRAVCYSLHLRLEVATDEIGAIRDAHEHIMQHITQSGLEGLEMLAHAEAAVCAMRLGDTAQAKHFLMLLTATAPRNADGAEACSAWRTDDSVKRAFGLSYLLAHDSRKASRLALSWCQRARNEERYASLIGALTLAALIEADAGNLDEARQHLREALVHASEMGCVQPIIDYWSFGVPGLLEHAGFAHHRELAEILRAVERAAHAEQVRVAGVPPDAGELSERELGVLQCLRLGQSNKTIARALKISENTVKFHTKNLFRKLGISRRSEVKYARAGAAATRAVGSEPRVTNGN